MSKLPRLKVTHKYGYYNEDLKCYQPVEQLVEVLTLNLNSSTMRVRTVDKVALFKDAEPIQQVFDTDIAPFFEHYKIEAAYDHI